MIGDFAGEYRIERRLSQGGMATVYAARHPVIDKRAAVKVLASDLSRDPVLVRRFVDEARAVNRICHPNVVDIFAFGLLPSGRHFLVMELLEGETLAARLEQGPLPIPLACRLLVQAASALDAAHRSGIVHRDLKPQNLFLVRTPDGEPQLKVLDFGIAKLLERSDGRDLTVSDGALGTPHFMSPEQCTGQRVDSRTDIYALGVIMYRLFAGRLPFSGATFAEVIAQHISAVPSWPAELAALPSTLQRLIARCLEKSPERRPESCAEIAERLLPWVARHSRPARAVGRLRRVRAPLQRLAGVLLCAWLTLMPGSSLEPMRAETRVAAAVSGMKPSRNSVVPKSVQASEQSCSLDSILDPAALRGNEPVEVRPVPRSIPRPRRPRAATPEPLLIQENPYEP